jgi:penicillin amidase/acyl-homoserine-lactone acylase
MKNAHNVLMLLALSFMAGCATTDSSTPSTSIVENTAPSEKLHSEKYSVKILRDTWGVPHVYGKTDPDVAFGLAYAHCEDDFKNIQDTMLATRSLGGAVNGANAASIDFIVHLLGVWDDVNAKYETDLSPETRALCEAYADGVNLYIEKHPDEVLLEEVFPVTGKDIVAGFVFKAPFFYGLDGAVLELFGPERRRDVSTKQAALGDFSIQTALANTKDFLTAQWPTGSNTFSVAPNRTSDGSTYLNVNSHQPFEGPVAWYEAHLHSEDGWDMVGGLFPGMPVIGHGHNRNLGWAMTVNSPDLADIYVLETNPDNPDQYKFDGEWLDFDIKEVTLKVRVTPDSPMTMKVRREVVRSVYGPVLRQTHGVYAIRYAGMGDIRQVEQWYRMNKADTHAEWLDAMKLQAIASLNVGYADKEGNISYIYNAKLPVRADGYNWEQYLPGNTSDTLWDTYLPFDELPMVFNPASGFVQNCNSSPFLTTFGDDNPDQSKYSTNFGIETHLSNRAMRARELFEADTSITWDEFYTYKFDMKYSEDSFLVNTLNQLLSITPPDDPQIRKALSILEKWDHNTNPESTGAALAVMTILPLNNSRGSVPADEKILESLSNAIEQLMNTHGQLNVPWEKVNRLVHGTTNLGTGGGPDILHAFYGGLNKENGTYIGRAGDCYVLLVKWDKDGNVASESIHQYGSATVHPDSPHYADQSPLFVKRQLKPVWYEESDIRAHLESEYVPGADRE